MMTAETPNNADRLVDLVTEGFCSLARITPPATGLAAGRALGTLLHRIDARHRNIARINMRFAFGQDMHPEQIERMVLRNFQQWGMIAFEWSRCRYLDRVAPGQMPFQVEVRDLHHLTAAKKKNRAVLLLSAHFGNWEYGHLHYASHLNRLNFIVRRIDNPCLEKKRVAYNQHHGVTILYKETGLKPAIKMLKKGQDLVIFADQKANPKEGISSRFFGRQTTTLPIVAALAQKYGLPIVPMFTIRKQNSTVHRLVFLPELAWSADESIHGIVRRQNDIIEKMIRRYPDHWLWMHRKWKTEYPQLYMGI